MAFPTLNKNSSNRNTENSKLHTFIYTYSWIDLRNISCNQQQKITNTMLKTCIAGKCHVVESYSSLFNDNTERFI